MRNFTLQNTFQTSALECRWTYGMGIKSRAFQGFRDFRYGFNGKENDDEAKGAGNQLDFGARIYDPRIGKFLSLDPLMAKYPELSPYCFAANCPIRLIDVNGEGAGDPFKSERAAAKDFAKNYNDNSIKDNLEIGTFIYYDKVKKVYSYFVPQEAPKTDAGKSEITVIQKYDAETIELKAIIHTHGAYDLEMKKGNDIFSDTDLKIETSEDGKRTRNMKEVKYNAYVVTPDGKLQFRSKKSPSTIRQGTVLGTDYAADKNDPAATKKGVFKTMFGRKDEPLIKQEAPKKEEDAPPTGCQKSPCE